MIKHSFTTLKSGLPVIQVPMKSVQSVTVLALCNTGSRYEKPTQFGIAHFFEHMVFKGTEKYPEAQTLAEAIDAVGANFNAFTGKEYTGYYVKAASDHLELALDVVSDMLLQPKLRQEDIDREKGVIIEEMNMYADTPARSVGDLFDRMVFAGSGLGHDIIGVKRSINDMTRRQFLNFLRSWYGLGNMVLIVAGDAKVVSKESTLKAIDEAFSKETDLRIRSKVVLKNFIEKKGPVSSKKLEVEYKKTEQAHFVVGWPGFDRSDERRYALNLLKVILGGNMSSRLFSEVREQRGLAYYVSSFNDMYHDGGVFGAQAGVDPKRVEEALEVTLQTFADVAAGEHPITEEELQKAKDYISGKMALNLEDSESVAQYFGMKQLLEDEIHSPEEVLKKIEAVKLDEVNALAKEIVQRREARLAIIGPFKSKDRFKKILNKF